MRRARHSFMLAAALYASLPVTDAESGCHHYSVWHYRFPQTCGANNRVKLPAFRKVALALAPQPAPPKPPSPYDASTLQSLREALARARRMTDDDLKLSLANRLSADLEGK